MSEETPPPVERPVDEPVDERVSWSAAEFAALLAGHAARVRLQTLLQVLELLNLEVSLGVPPERREGHAAVHQLVRNLTRDAARALL